MIRLFDTARGEVRDLVVREPGRLSMYVCGPTVYDLPHLGHGRFTLVWDVARRWFSFQGFDVRYVSNITDIDDNIINRARRTSQSEGEVAATFEAEWWRAMDAIGVARPSDVPHATQYVAEMTEFISDLLRRGVAYIISDGVYFDTSCVADYGLLALQPLDSLRAGARVESLDEKRSPLDFALWKNAKPDEPSWSAPFGEGRPGWHTECVVMSLGLLGEGFDLHCGGYDLKFPHHENERAQAVAAGRDFAHHWAHNGWVMVGDEKMSKSSGNFTSLTDLLTSTDARAYRLLVIRSHYRSPIEVSPATIADAERALERLDAVARRFSLPALGGSSMVRRSDYSFSEPVNQALDTICRALDDDLNAPLAVSQIFEFVSLANQLADLGDPQGAEWAQLINVVLGALGITLNGQVDTIDLASQELVERRDAARVARDWSLADQLRDELGSRGWIVEDSPHGTQIRRN